MSTFAGKHTECDNPDCKDGCIPSTTHGKRECPRCEFLRKRDIPRRIEVGKRVAPSHDDRKSLRRRSGAWGTL